jgi:hypothetical protein
VKVQYVQYVCERVQYVTGGFISRYMQCTFSSLPFLSNVRLTIRPYVIHDTLSATCIHTDGRAHHGRDMRSVLSRQCVSRFTLQYTMKKTIYDTVLYCIMKPLLKGGSIDRYRK